MLDFEYETYIAAPVEEVFAFHERPDAIELLCPPWQKLRVVRRVGGLEAGSLVEFRIWFGPLPRKWVAHHIAYEKNRLFMDEQREGPFEAWVHAHRFEPEGTGTRLIDSIEFAPPFSALSEPLMGWFMKREMRRLFEYRHRVTKEYCEKRR